MFILLCISSRVTNAIKIPKDIKILLLKVIEMQDMPLLLSIKWQTLMKLPLCKFIYQRTPKMKLEISINYKIHVWEERSR